MMRCFSVEFQDGIPLYDTIHCRRCRNQVALVRDYIRLWPRGIFHRVFNVVEPDNVKYHRRILGHTVANTTCAQCGAMLGWKIIAVTFQNSLFREGRFLMKLDKLSIWDQKPLLRINKVQDLGANEQDGDATDQDRDTTDQDGGASEQVPNDQNGDANELVPTDQDLGANGQNADQDGDANELVPTEQKVGTDEQNVDQDEDTDEEDVGAIQYNVRNILVHFICQNAYQGGGGNEQVPNEQDVGANEEVPNEQDYETLVFQVKTELSKLNRQLIKINTLQSKLDTLLIKMGTTNQDGNATDQGLGANDQNANQDGDATDQDRDTTDQMETLQ